MFLRKRRVIVSESEASEAVVSILVVVELAVEGSSWRRTLLRIACHSKPDSLDLGSENVETWLCLTGETTSIQGRSMLLK